MMISAVELERKGERLPVTLLGPDKISVPHLVKSFVVEPSDLFAELTLAMEAYADPYPCGTTDDHEEQRAED